MKQKVLFAKFLLVLLLSGNLSGQSFIPENNKLTVHNLMSNPNKVVRTGTPIYILDESFDSGLPAGWQNVVNQGEGWSFFQNPFSHTVIYYFGDMARNANLITSPLEKGNLSQITLGINHRLYAYNEGFTCKILKSSDGVNWSTVIEFTTGDQNAEFEYVEFSLENSKSTNPLYLSFTADFPFLPDYYEVVWEIESVKVFGYQAGYNVTFEVEDEDGNALTDAIVTLNGVSNPAGDYLFENIEPGTYDYSVELSGYITANGQVTVTDQDVVENVVLTQPLIINEFPWVEGFDNGLPEGWQNVVNEGNGFAFAQNPYTHTYIYYFGDAQRNAMLVTPLLDLNGLETVKLGVFHRIYAYGQGWSNKILKSTDGQNWDVVAEFTEGFNPDVNQYMEFDITPAKSGEMIYLAFAVDYPLLPDYYEVVWEIVDVTVFEPIPTFNVTFNVEDEDGNALTDAIVTLNGVSNPAGDYLFEDIEPGFYNYNVELEGYMPGAGEVEVIDQNITVTVYLEKIGQLVNLIEGWSLISSYQNPETNTLEEIFANQLANENLVIMLNQSGFFWPVNNINTLGNWNPYMGYKVKMNAADIVNVKGDMVENLTVELNQGVNYLPVLSKFPVEASEVFNQIADKILYVFDLVNGFIYWPAGGLNNLEVLEPGMAYLVGMSNPGTIIFPASNLKAIATQNPVTIINSPWMVEKTGNVHIISIADNSVDEGDIIAAFNSTGRCVGIVQKSGVSGNLGLIVYGDDPTTQIIDGMTEFETMSFRIFKFNTSEIIDVTPVWNMNMPNAGFFTENGLSSISAFTSEANGVSYNGQVSVMIYPNPASSFISIEAPDRKISSVEIYDQLGQLIISTPLTHELNRINITDLRPGIHMVKVLDGNQILSVSKLIVK